MHSADILPASRHQKSLTTKDFHLKSFDVNDYLLAKSTDDAYPGHNKELSYLMSMLHEKGPLNNKTPSRHADFEKDMDDTKCTFLRIMQAVDWENPEPMSKTMYETDFVSKLSPNPSRTIIKSSLDPSSHDGMLSHICNDAYKSGKSFETSDLSMMLSSNDSIKKDFKKKLVDLPDRICKKEKSLPKFQYTEPLLFPSEHCELTAPLINAKDVSKRWQQIMENTQSKRHKINLKLDGKCLPCYKKTLSSSEKDSEPSSTFVPTTTTEQVLDKCKQPKWRATVENLNPNYYKRDDFAESTNKRVFQAADRVISEVPPVSETAESLQRTMELLPDVKAAEQKTNIAVPSKAKSYAEFISPNIVEFPFTTEPCLRSSELRNIISADAYKGYDPNIKSVTKSDFHPKVPTYENGTDVLNYGISRNSPKVQFRKTRSQLEDLHCPRREGIIKFMDDEDPSLLRYYRR